MSIVRKLRQDDTLKKFGLGAGDVARSVECLSIVECVKPQVPLPALRNWVWHTHRILAFRR